MAKKITQEYLLKVVASGLKEVTAEIKTLNTNLTGVDKSVNATGEAFDKAGKSNATLVKNLKGTGNATNNSTKAFSKMAQGMQGSLVPAYATVAANVFALTAAFGALKRAADLEILINSAETFAIQTGRSLINLSKDMKVITGGALTLKESLESASIAASAGFDDTTIKNLTQVAKNASVALGRDLTDSLNRVFKGAIKAEPELLDELGIILRLDTAARNYAATLGKSAAALTTFEKQQAVVNAVIEQGESKFGDFADVDINPYTQLAAAFHDVSASLIAIINIPISPVLTFLADNITALTAVIVLFSASVLKKAFPALSNFAETMETKLAKATERASASLKKAEASSISFAKSMKGSTEEGRQALTKFSSAVYQVQDVVESSKKVISKNFKEAFTFGTDTVKGVKAYEKGLVGVLAAFKRGTKVSQGFKNTTKDIQFLNDELIETRAVLKGLDSATIKSQTSFQAFGSGVVQTFAKARSSVVAFTATLAKGATAGALAGYTQGFSGISASLKVVTAETKGFTKYMTLATTGIAGLGGAFLRMLPIIGQVVFAWTLLSSAFTFIKDLAFGKSLVDLNKTLEDNEEALNTAAKSAVFYNNKLKDLPDTIDNVDKKATLLSNTLDSLANKLETTLGDITIDGDFTAFDSFLDSLGFGNLDTFKDQLNEINNTIQSFGFNKESNSIIKEFGDLLRISGNSAHFAGERMLVLLKSLRDTERGTKELNNVLKEALADLSKGFTQLNDGLPALNGVERGFSNLNTILSTMDTGNIQLVVSSIEKLSNFDLRELGLLTVANNIADIKKPLGGFTKSLKNAKAELKAFQAIVDAQRAQEETGGFEIVTEDTLGHLAFLTGLVNSYQGAIKGVNEELAGQSENIVKQLEKVREKFEKIIAAQRLIADIRSGNAIANLEQGKGLDTRLKLLNDLTDAENSYISTITKQTRFSLASIDKSISDVQTKLLTATIADQAGLEIELKNTLNKKQQLENKLLENRNKIVGNYMKQVKAVQKELDKTTKFAAAGLTVSEEQSKILQTELYTAFLNIGTAQGKNIQDATTFAAKMTLAAVAVQDFNKFLLQTRIPSVSALIGDVSGLDARAEALDIEANYLEKNNTLLSERIDKEFILAKTINDRLISEAGAEVARLAATDTDAGNQSQVEVDALNTLNALKLKGQNLDKVGEKTVKKLISIKLKGMKKELSNSKQLLGLGILATKSQIKAAKTEQLLQKLRGKGFKDASKELKSLTKQQQEVDFAQEFNDSIASVVEGMSEYSSIINELNENLDNLSDNQKAAAGMKALGDIAAKSGNNVSKAFADMALLVDVYSDRLATGEATAREWSDFTMSALGAMSQLYEEGSSQAKALAAAQQVLAIVNAVASITNAATSGDPYTAPARVAHMIGLMSAVLGLAGIGFGGGGDAGSSADAAANAYKETISEQGLVGARDLETISLIESIDDLVSIDTDLFSITRDLQLSIDDLGDVFDRVAQVLVSTAGNFGEVNASQQFGATFGDQEFGIKSDIGGDFAKLIGNLDIASKTLNSVVGKVLDATGFSSKKISAVLVDSGIKFGASINAVSGNLAGSIENAQAFLVSSITTTTKKYWGLSSKTSTRLVEDFRALPTNISGEFQNALDQTLNSITGIFKVFGEAVDVNLTNLFSGIGTIQIEALKLSLKDKSTQEQSDAIAAWFSNMGNTVIATVIPFISDYSNVGEELLDTLIRITGSTIKLTEAFKKVGLDIDFIVDTSSINVSTIPLDISGAQSSIDSVVESLKLEMIVAWQDSFLKNFKDFDEFTEIFDKFSSALYSETELLQQALTNSEVVVNNGFDMLRQSLAAFGETELLAALGDTNTTEALRSIYELGIELNSFAARIDSSTGEIDTSGADLLATLLQLGSALGDQEALVTDLVDAMDNLNERYLRQITTFGIVSKELDLLELSFDFEDAIREAEETGTDLALVETYYGLLRLDIYKKYNQEIVDSITETMESVSNSMLSILSSASGWDEIAYQSIRISKIVNKLSTSLNTFRNSIDFSVFSDLTDSSDFLSTLEEFIDITVGSANNISDQINLVEELREAVISRYEAEASATEELESSIMSTIEGLKDLSSEINAFLDDLFVGDLSPLTNAQKLAEAQSQFDENLQNVVSQDSELAAAAREDLLESASTLLELGSLFFAIGPEYQAIFDGVVGSLEALDQNLLTQITASEETLAITSLEESLTTLQLETLTQLGTLDTILVALEEQNATNLSTELSNYLPEISTSLDTIVSQLSISNDSTWTPMYNEIVSLNNSISSFFNNIGSFAKGSEEISYDQVAMIHKGETILTSDTANAIRSGDSIYGATEAITSSGSGDNSNVVDAIRVLTQVVATGQEDIIDKNEEVRVATNSIGNNLSVVEATSTKGIL